MTGPQGEALFLYKRDQETAEEEPGEGLGHLRAGWQPRPAASTCSPAADPAQAKPTLSRRGMSQGISVLTSSSQRELQEELLEKLFTSVALRPGFPLAPRAAQD